MKSKGVPSQPKISVVVLNWNGKRFIDKFVKTFQAQTYPKENLELLFTDNASSDDSVDYFEKNYSSDPRLKIVRNDGNYGYAKGNNLGMLNASGDYILVCNNDLELDKNLVKNLVSCLQNNRADLVVPKLMYLNKAGVINNAGSRLDPTNDWPIHEIGANEQDTGQYDREREISAFCGACVLFKKSFLQTVGMFDSKFFMYFEDGDLSWRGQKAGKKFMYAPKAVAYHVHTGSSKEGSPLFNHFVGRNRLLILAKNAPLKTLLVAWAKSINVHLFMRSKRVLLSVFRKYPRRLALKEFYLSQKMLWAAFFMTPYALAKRFGIIKEETL